MNWELSRLLLPQDDAKESLSLALRWSTLRAGSCGIGSKEVVAAAAAVPSNNWDGLLEYGVSAVADGACSRNAEYSEGKRRLSLPVMRCWPRLSVHTRRTVLMAHLLECRDCTRGSAVARNLITKIRNRSQSMHTL